MTANLPLPALLDGATGTELQKRGMPQGVCTEAWILEHPQVLEALQRAYLQAGADILTAPTFGANPASLARFGLEARTGEYNRRLVELTQQVGGEKVKVAGNLAPCGLRKIGMEEGQFSALVENYRTQAAALQEAGVDLYLLETMLDLQEAQAAVQAVREVDGERPILITFYCDGQGRTPAGVELPIALAAMEKMGVSAFGVNCVTPETAQRQLERLSSHSALPLVAQPEGTGRDPKAFAAWVEPFYALGVRYFGGCCRTGPETIAQLRKKLDETLTLHKG